MVTALGFCDPVYFAKPSTWSQYAQNMAESYFQWKARDVLWIKDADTQEVSRYAPAFWVTAIKIISLATIIIPLVMLAIKAYVHNMNSKIEWKDLRSVMPNPGLSQTDNPDQSIDEMQIYDDARLQLPNQALYIWQALASVPEDVGGAAGITNGVLKDQSFEEFGMIEKYFLREKNFVDQDEAIYPLVKKVIKDVPESFRKGERIVFWDGCIMSKKSLARGMTELQRIDWDDQTVQKNFKKIYDLCQGQVANIPVEDSDLLDWMKQVGLGGFIVNGNNIDDDVVCFLRNALVETVADGIRVRCTADLQGRILPIFKIGNGR